ncbi:sodium channel protein Nach-like [Copidosoma floridanum]|uniref:sodium channel protein Nach-like n=1 Tax=Copidosoma floridanum TaxID=29053 RepID=UPI0006C9B0D4|nr:sodium channel protein Nach-like [Copidosoma floridanum]
MTKAWTYNSIHSTLAVIQTTHHGVWNHLFPAVTVCNHNLVSLKKARKFVNELKYLQGFSRDYVLKEMQLLAEMVDPGIFGYDVYFNLTALQNVFHANNYTAPQIMKLVKQDCSVLLRNCKWKGETESCEDIFEEVYVRDGICCSFNFFHNNTKINNGRRPQQVSACGYQTALSFEVHPEPEDYHVALYPSYGVKTLIHYPYDHPYRSCQYKLISLGVQNFMNVKPQEFYSTRNTKSLPLRSRQCLSENDQVPEPLQLLMRNYTMLKYSYVNCLTNCRTSVVVNECGCAPFYVPQNRTSLILIAYRIWFFTFLYRHVQTIVLDTRVCNLRDLICMKKIQRLYDMSWPTLDMYSDDLLEADIDITTRPCGCLPDCTIYSYPLYSTQAHLQKAYTSSRLSEDAGNFGNFSIINVFYEDLVTTRYRRDHLLEVY